MTKGRFLRWAMPLLATALFGAASACIYADYHDPTRYRNYYVALFLTTGLLGGCSWWIALSGQRYRRFARRAAQRTTLSLLLLIFGALALLDLVIDATPVAVLLPVAFSLLAIRATMEKPPMAGLRPPLLSDLLNSTALLVGSAVITVLLAETAFRHILSKSEVPTSDQEFEQLIASAWPRPIGRQPDAQTFRILSLSDSFGWAGGEKNYAYVLEALLTDAGIDVEVVNFSRGGYEPFDQLALLKRFGAAYQPDLILHGFFVGNDFETPQAHLRTYKGITVRPLAGLDSYRPHYFFLRRWLANLMIVLRDNSQKASEQAVAKLTRPVAGSRQSVALLGGSSSSTHGEPPAQPGSFGPPVHAQVRQTDSECKARPAAGTFSQAEFLRIGKTRLRLYRPGPPPSARWPKTATLLAAIRAEADRIGSDYMMVIHPDQLQVEPGVVEAVRQHYNLDLGGYDLKLPQQFLMDGCLQQNIKCLDLLPTFSQAAGPLYLLRDTHYNASGNRLAAQAILDLMQEMGMVSDIRQSK